MSPTGALAAPTLEQIRAARERLAGIVRPTPPPRRTLPAEIGSTRDRTGRATIFELLFSLAVRFTENQYTSVLFAKSRHRGNRCPLKLLLYFNDDLNRERLLLEALDLCLGHRDNELRCLRA